MHKGENHNQQEHWKHEKVFRHTEEFLLEIEVN